MELRDHDLTRSAPHAGVLYVDSLSEAGGPVPSYLALLQRDADTIVAGLTGGT